MPQHSNGELGADCSQQTPPRLCKTDKKITKYLNIYKSTFLGADTVNTELDYQIMAGFGERYYSQLKKNIIKLNG